MIFNLWFNGLIRFIWSYFDSDYQCVRKYMTIAFRFKEDLTILWNDIEIEYRCVNGGAGTYTDGIYCLCSMSITLINLSTNGRYGKSDSIEKIQKSWFSRSAFFWNYKLILVHSHSSSHSCISCSVITTTFIFRFINYYSFCSQ